MKTMLAIIMILTSGAYAQGPQYPYSVNLSFTASIGTVTGYNMYRNTYTTYCSALTSGTWVKVNTTPFTGTSYVDSNPPQGTWCYAATAVNGSAESGLSAPIANVVVPPPPPTGLEAVIASGTKSSVIWAWSQSAGKGLTRNTLFCHTKTPGPPWNVRVKSSKPVTDFVIDMESGTHYCAVSANAGGSESGVSNQVAITIE